MRKNLKTRLAALLCAAALLAAMMPAAAASAASVSIGSSSVSQGGTCTLTVAASQFEKITSLQLTIAYNATAFDVTETVTKSMDVATADHRTDGTVEYIGISMDGLSGSPELLSITFLAAANAAPGNYPVTLFVKGATAAGSDGGDYNTTVAVHAGTLTIQESGTVYFYSRLNSAAAETGSEVTMTVSSHSTAGLAGGRFVFLYDSNMLEYKTGSATLLSPMTKQEHTVSVNDSNPGRVSVAYAATDSVGTGDLMQITFVAKATVSGTTQITMTPESLVDINGGVVTGISASSSIPITQKSRAWIRMSEAMSTHETFTAEFWVEGGDHFAAGDFSVAYDTALLECLAVTSSFSSGESGGSGNGFVVINDDFGDGSIEFSVLCPGGIKTDTGFLSMTFRARRTSDSDITLIPATETTPVNASGDPIDLLCSPAVAHLQDPDHRCENGYCFDCGKDLAVIFAEKEQAVISIPGVSEEATIIVSFCNAAGKMLRCEVYTAEKAANLTVQRKNADHITVFVLGADWCPLRDAIREGD